MKINKYFNKTLVLLFLSPLGVFSSEGSAKLNVANTEKPAIINANKEKRMQKKESLIETGHIVTEEIEYGERELLAWKDVPFFALTGSKLVKKKTFVTFDDINESYSFSFIGTEKNVDWLISSSNIKEGSVMKMKLQCGEPGKEISNKCRFKINGYKCIIEREPQKNYVDPDKQGNFVGEIYSRKVFCDGLKGETKKMKTKFSEIVFFGDLDKDNALDIIGKSSSNCGNSFYWEEINVKKDVVEIEHHATGYGGGCLSSVD